MIRFSTSITMMFLEHAILDRFSAARAAGFCGVEIQNLVAGEPHAMAQAAAETELPVVLVNVPTGDFAAGGLGLSGVPGRERAFQNELKRTLEAATIMGVPFVHLGPSRVPDGRTREASLRIYRENLNLSLHLAEPHNVTLLIEPINTTDNPTALLTRLDEAARLIEEAGSSHLGLLFDVYHTAMNGLDPQQSFGRYLPLIRHIQFSDVPGRQEPGSGSIDFEAVFSAIRSSPYDGWVGAEYHPSKATADTLGWLTTFGCRAAS